MPMTSAVKSSFLTLCVSMVLLLLMLSACTRPGNDIYKQQVFAFGTVVEVSIWGLDQQQARQVVAELMSGFEYLNRTLHPRQGGSLARINELLPHGADFSASPAVLPLIKQSTDLSRKSDYLFNPAIGSLVRLWQFDQMPEEGLKPPPAHAIQSLVDMNMTMENLQIKGISMRSDVKELLLDFGAIGKGFAVDKAIEQLKDMGVDNAIVNAGGDLRAIGQPGDRKWKVAVRHPRQQGMIASLDIAGDESVFTSGDYERFYEYQGQRYHHILDPRTGYPATDVMSVTVIHHDATTADAAATALFVAGPEQWHRVAKAMGIKWVMLVDKDMRVHMNPAMAQRISFTGKPPEKLILSDVL